MNFPFYIYIGETKILIHTLFEVLAFFIGFRYFLYLKKVKGDVIGDNNRVWIIIGAIAGSLIGSRLVGGLENPLQLMKAENVLVHFYNNKTILGGLLGGVFGVELVKLVIKEKQASGDLFVYPIILALIIGRIGCFSMGVAEETYGVSTSFFTGIDLGDGIARHPVTLYEIVFLVFLWGALQVLSAKQHLAPGSLFKLFMIGYILFRFFLDFIKPHYIIALGLSTIQITCLLGLIWYVSYLIHPKKFLQPLCYA